MASHSALSGLGTHGWRAPMDCLRASEVCNQNSQCSSRFRIMRQCLVGRDRTTMLANRECQAALEVLQDSPLYDCRCKRGMKRELQCLQSYWSIHMGLNEGKNVFLILTCFSVPSYMQAIFEGWFLWKVYCGIVCLGILLSSKQLLNQWCMERDYLFGEQCDTLCL